MLTAAGTVALAVEVLTSTDTAAATATSPSLVEASPFSELASPLVCDCCAASPTPDPVSIDEADVVSLPTLSSTLASSDELVGVSPAADEPPLASAAPLPPEADAVDPTLLSDAPEAAIVTEPADPVAVPSAVRLEVVVALEASVTTATATAAPTAADPPAAVPLASVASVAVCVELTRIEPSTLSVPVLTAPMLAVL
jgi:hypothetical protein